MHDLDLFAVATEEQIDETYGRMIAIFELTKPTRAAEILTEYSALMCAASILVAVSRGMDMTEENCCKILRSLTGIILPEIEAMYPHPRHGSTGRKKSVRPDGWITWVTGD